MSEMTNSELPVCETMEEKMTIPRRKESLKRRSSIFQRRSILLTAQRSKTEEFDESKTTNVIFPTETPTNEDGAKVDEVIEPFNLRAYIDRLKREKQDWQEIHRDRRTCYRNLVKKKAKIEENGQEVDLSILTESERNFIDGRPNYEHILESSKALVEMAVKLTILNKYCTQLNEKFHDKMEQNIKEATKKIISMVD